MTVDGAEEVLDMELIIAISPATVAQHERNASRRGPRTDSVTIRAFASPNTRPEVRC